MEVTFPFLKMGCIAGGLMVAIAWKWASRIGLHIENGKNAYNKI